MILRATFPVVASQCVAKHGVEWFLFLGLIVQLVAQWQEQVLDSYRWGFFVSAMKISRPKIGATMSK